MPSKINPAVKTMKDGGSKLASIKKELVTMVKPGITLAQIETRAQELIAKAGGAPSFATVPGYSWATCLNLNDGLVHGVPNPQAIREGDVVSIDVGLYYRGFHTDTSVSFIASILDPASIKQKYPDKFQFLTVGKQALAEAIGKAKAGNHVGHISQAIQAVVESAGYSVARNLTGHGIGKKLHQSPTIPCFLDEDIRQTPKLTAGMTLAIEAIYLLGSSDTTTDGDDYWTIRSRDGKITAVFEETIVVTDDGPIILTKF